MKGTLLALVGAPRFQRLAWLALIVGVLGFYKIALTSHTFTPNVDGGYYMDVAEHVKNGEGLVSSSSTLHAGYPRFPHPTAVYPLWPLLVGYAAKVFPLLDAGRWLATLCYFATLGFGYLWGAALVPTPLLPRAAPGFNAGHVVALMFGLHDFFFTFTSWPYTEGLSFALACAALWRMTRLWPKPSWLAGVELGVWLGLAILARYQMVLMAMAAFPVLVGAALLSTGPRRQYAAMALTTLAALLVVVGPHYLYVRSFTPGLTPGLYVQWQRVRFSEGLSLIPDVRELHGVAWIADRAKGIALAFDPRDTKFSYFIRFYTLPYGLVVVLPLVAWRVAQRASRPAREATWAWLRAPENLNWIYVVTFATGSLVMIHSLHMSPEIYPEWYFAQRHAIVCMFAFCLAIVFLLAQKSALWSLVGVAILGSSAYLGVGAIRVHVHAVESATPPGPSAFVAWLNEEAARRGGMTIVLRQPQVIAYMTRGVGYHWYYWATTVQDIRRMVELGAAYVVVPGGQSYSFAQTKEFAQWFRQVKIIEGNRIYEPTAALARPQREP